MNTTVQATNMQVKAVAEKGLLINEVAAANSTTWDEEATAKQAGTGTPAPTSMLYPSSTKNGTDWYHAASKKANDEAGASSSAFSPELVENSFVTLGTLADIELQSAGATAGSQAAFATKGTATTSEAGYYVVYTYYLKGAYGQDVPLNVTSGAMNVKIAEVKATLPTGSDLKSEALDKAVRVGVKLNSELFIFAPVSGATGTYYVGTAHDAVTPKNGASAVITDLDELPSVNDAGTPVYVYIWYEGEDENCKSVNTVAETLDNIKIDIKFTLEEVTSTEATEWATAHPSNNP